MANCCQYWFGSYAYVALGATRVSEVRVLINNITYDVTIGGTATFPDFAGVSSDIENSLLTAGIPGAIGQWAFNIRGDGTAFYIYVTGVNFNDGNNIYGNDSYVRVMLDTGNSSLAKISLDGLSLSRCAECEEDAQEGTIIHCETCMEVFYSACPETLVISTGLFNGIYYYAWFIDRNAHRYVIPVESIDGNGVATINVLEHIPENKFMHTGVWEINISTSETINTKESIINNGTSYPCIILKFEDIN